MNPKGILVISTNTPTIFNGHLKLTVFAYFWLRQPLTCLLESEPREKPKPNDLLLKKFNGRQCQAPTAKTFKNKWAQKHILTQANFSLTLSLSLSQISISQLKALHLNFFQSQNLLLIGHHSGELAGIGLVIFPEFQESYYIHQYKL